MNRSIFLLVSGLFVVGSVFAASSDELPAYTLPAGTKITLKLKADLDVLANTTITQMGEVYVDSDGDGVPDYLDWCPNTPSGKPVWTEKDFNAGKVPYSNIGCSGSGEKWIYDASNTGTAPSGFGLSCTLYHDASPDGRVLGKADVLSVVGGKEGEKAAQLSVKTFGGKSLEIGCTKIYRWVRFWKFDGSYSDFDRVYSVPTRADLSLLLSVSEVPVPKPIP